MIYANYQEKNTEKIAKAEENIFQLLLLLLEIELRVNVNIMEKRNDRN